MQLKYHVYNIQKVQLKAKSTKFRGSVQQVKACVCVVVEPCPLYCHNLRLNQVIQKQFLLEILLKRMSCYPCFIGCAALFLLDFQVGECVYRRYSDEMLHYSTKLPGFCLLRSVRRKISVIFSYFSCTQLKTVLES